ncbi:MAG: hypothetical protein GW839_02325 [Flavobacteriales bacterium]|nr:hypothetical protein [Flavobacteriia bacterium]NCP04898.1 hypothetical protein [Flavobacteriales bacterium]PIY11696.1 MAG: hypothetical protein COZ17_05955 [Flavobacteriaceae bacterium CG_4_10_14_3_um_filter_33_47]PJB16945.1 MAG: hypothetical protein CO117_13435 [Flavobacteriaceae bacterium CG_4_9_14_3_um_filter_33_16]NCP51251.1 hypothetical protein [Flavobacteriales bacterium]
MKAQDIVRSFDKNSFANEEISTLKAEFGNHKLLIADYEKPMLIALSYFPELKPVKIKFRLKKRATPLATRPSLFSMLRSAKKRTYVITISKKSTTYIDTITFKNLRFDAQIGVLGHELSHVSDYLNKGFGKMLTVGKNELFCPILVDKAEYQTDLSCINHGLGYQLLDWSINVRENLQRPNWLGAVNLDKNENSERYMNPETIKAILKTHPRYQLNAEKLMDVSIKGY